MAAYTYETNQYNKNIEVLNPSKDQPFSIGIVGSLARGSGQRMACKSSAVNLSCHFLEETNVSLLSWLTPGLDNLNPNGDRSQENIRTVHHFPPLLRIWLTFRPLQVFLWTPCAATQITLDASRRCLCNPGAHHLVQLGNRGKRANTGPPGITTRLNGHCR